MAVLRVPRALHRYRCAGDYAASPPVLVNSVPKSGTHLLHAVAAVLPGVRDYHSFVASVPPVVHRPRSEAATRARLRRIAPGELLRAHLWHSDEAAEDLERLNVVHLLIIRDPRDVLVSEAHYLAEMAPWHSLHRAFADRPDLPERVRLAIEGLDTGQQPWYPPVALRLEPYVRWIAQPRVHTFRYEDLVGERRADAIRGVVAAYAAAAPPGIDVEDVTARAVRAADEGRPHTFRKGGSGGWRSVFTDEHRDLFKRHAGDLLVRLGYEQDDAW
jgi:sulfotransferase 6B1